MTRDQLSTLARQSGATHFTPAPLRAVRGWSFTYDQLAAFANALTAPPAAQPQCEHCGGTGEVLAHAENCFDDLCALNGDVHSCVGHVEPCSCAAQLTAEPATSICKTSRARWPAGRRYTSNCA